MDEAWERAHRLESLIRGDVEVVTGGSLTAKDIVTNLKSTTKTLIITHADFGYYLHRIEPLIPFVARNTTLTRLRIEHCHLGQQGWLVLNAMRGNKTMIELEIVDNRLDDTVAAGVNEMLKWNTTLMSLDLSSNQLGDTGAWIIGLGLEENQTLRRLILSSNSIRRKGARELAESLRKNTALKELDLSHNYLEDEGAIAIADALRENTTLEKINLSNCLIGEAGITALFRTNRNVTVYEKFPLFKRHERFAALFASTSPFFHARGGDVSLTLLE